MSKKQKALTLADELGLSIHKAHMYWLSGVGKGWYYIIKHKDAVAWNDFNIYENQGRFFTYMNEVSKRMMLDSWADCIDEMEQIKAELS